jgi:Ca-activated chloride channel family protein
MFRFENPEYLYFLIAIPIFVLLYIYTRILRRKRLKRLGDVRLIAKLMPDVSCRRPLIKFLLCLLALTSLIIMVARPQMGLKMETNEHKGIELMVALDVSNSMLAADVTPDRMDKAKMLVSNIADKLTNDKIGLVVFAGDAFIQMPITSDFVSAKMFLDAISPNMIGTQGTNISDAVRMCANSFTNQKHVQRAIIIITDGEDHEGDAEAAAADAAKKGIKVFVLGIGSAKGATIPYNEGYLKDRQGNVVVTRLNENMCQRIASAGKGVYIHVDNSNIAQDRLYYELNKMEKQDLGATSYSDYDEQFQIFAWIALLLLVLEITILEKKNPYFRRFKIFKDNDNNKE